MCYLDLGVNLNDIKSSAVLQPLTSDRPKNPAKNPPTKYGRPTSPVRDIFVLSCVLHVILTSLFTFPHQQKKAVTPEVKSVCILLL